MADTAGRELRIALSMRGGVSLAVWIGGAAREIDALTRNPAAAWDPDARDSNWYAGLLRLGGYERATIDVITGASAGGLNGVVLAASRVYGFPFHRMLPLWVEVADIELLSRDPLAKEPGEDGKPTRRPASLMRGDGYFLDRLERQLRALVAEGHDSDAVEDPLQLILSATLVNPSYEVTDEDPFAPMPEVRRDASFQFRYLGDGGGDFEQRDAAVAPTDRSTVALLALAGRATSSFPVAFEPATVRAGARQVFSDPPTGSDTQRVIDGGVLDNIPVTKAIEAIADAPPSPRAERWLMFLHPSPGTRTAESLSADRRASPQALATLIVTAGAAFSQESLLDDLAELERYNAEASWLRLRRRAALAEISLDEYQRKLALPTGAGDDAERGGPNLGAVRKRRQEASREAYAQIEAVRTVRLLTGELRVNEDGDAIPTMGALGSLVRSRQRSVVVALEQAYGSQVADATALRAVVAGVGVAVELVAEWLGRLGAASTPTTDADTQAVLASTSVALGQLRRLVRAMRRWSDLAWVHAGAAARDPSSAWVAATTAVVLDIARYTPPEPTARLAAALAPAAEPVPTAGSVPGFDAALAALDQAVLEQIEARVGLGAGRGTDLSAFVWERLVGLLGQLQPIGEPRAGRPDADVLDLLFGRPDVAGGFERILTDLVVVLTYAQASSQTSDTEVRFVRVSAANQSPLDARFAPEPPPGSDPTLTAGDKLCGNELANFAAFLSARWRANDWMWGRMDAAKSLVDLTVRPARLAASRLSVEEVLATVDRLVLDGGQALDDGARQRVRREVVAVKTNPAGFDETTGLAFTRSLLTEAVQRRIFAEMEPVIGRLDESPVWPGLPVPGGLGAGSVATPSPAVAPDAPLDQSMERYRVGRETLADLRSRRRTQIGMRLALVGYGALKPLKGGAPSRIVRLAMAATKPFMLFGAFAALNVARAWFLVNMVLVGFWVGPWRYRGSRGHSPEEIVTYRRLPWEGGEWWPDQLAPGGWLGWIGLGVIGAVSLYCLWRAARLLIGGRAHSVTPNKRRRDLGWYAASGIAAPVVVVGAAATGIATGPVLVAVLAGGVGALTCLWMKPWATLTVGALVTMTYVAVGAAGSALVGLTDRPWFSFTFWMSLVALYAAQLVIALTCTYLRVLPDEDEILRRARRQATKG